MAAIHRRSYRTLLGRAGFGAIETEDVSVEWRAVLRARVARFRAARAETVGTMGETVYAEYDQLFAFFVGLVEGGKLGGGRFTATR